MNKKIIRNVFYQAIYQMTIILLPIITIPIVSHALGSDGLGLYSYITSVTSYFILLAGLGLNNYGIREIAKSKKNKQELSYVFWSLEFFNIIVVCVVIILYLLFLFLVNFNIYFLVSGITVLATFVDISWFYYGVEDFKQITLINLLVKIISFCLIVMLIDNKNDLLLYFIIQSASIFVSNLSLWLFLKQKVYFVKPSWKSIKSHFKPALNYFIGKASITIYTTLNKTILGLLGTTVAVGLYTNSLQLSSMVIMLVGTIDSVLLPHMTVLVTSNKENQLIELMQKIIDFQLYLTFPLALGLVAINNKLIPWFFGPEFSYLKYTVPVVAPLIIIIPLGTSVVRQYLVPMNRIRSFNISVIVAAFIGLITNLVLIPHIGIWGALIATLLSEIFVTSIRLIDLLKNTDFSFKLKSIQIYLLSSLIMYIAVLNITKTMEARLITTCVQVLLGSIIYFFITTVTKNNPVISIYRNLKEK